MVLFFGLLRATEGYTDEDDHSVVITVDDDKYFAEIYNVKSSWQYTCWEGGKVEITIGGTANTIDMILRPGDTGELLPGEINQGMLKCYLIF